MLGACVDCYRILFQRFLSSLFLCLNQHCLVVGQGRHARAENLLSSLPCFLLFLTLECEYREGMKVTAKKAAGQYVNGQRVFWLLIILASLQSLNYF